MGQFGAVVSYHFFSGSSIVKGLNGSCFKPHATLFGKGILDVLQHDRKPYVLFDIEVFGVDSTSSTTQD